jgi:hypothetical protein
VAAGRPDPADRHSARHAADPCGCSVVGAAPAGRRRKRIGVRLRQLAPRPPPRPSRAPARLGTRRRRRRHRPVWHPCPDLPLSRRLAVRLVGLGRPRRRPRCWLVDAAARNIPCAHCRPGRRCTTRAPPAHSSLVQRAVRLLRAGGSRLHHRGHFPCRCHRADVPRLDRRRRVDTGRAGRSSILGSSGLAESAVVAPGPAARRAGRAGQWHRAARCARRGGAMQWSRRPCSVRPS